MPDKVVPDAEADEPSEEAPIEGSTIVLEIADQANLSVFCDDLGNPCVVIPTLEGDQVWPLRHDRIKAWIAERFHRQTGVFVTDKDLNQSFRVLEGRAWNSEKRSPTVDAVWRNIERDPVAIALIDFANQQGEFSGRTRDLFRELNSTRIVARLQNAGLISKFPVNTQAFSRGVSRVRDALKTLGLYVDLEHKQDGSHCKLVLAGATQSFARETEGHCVIASANTASVSRPKQVGEQSDDETYATDATLAEFRDDEGDPQALETIKQIREQKSGA